MNNINSNAFFHYTKDFECIKGIIRDGIKIFFCDEEFYTDRNTFEHIGIPMACFCDIPLSYIEQIRYGDGKTCIALKHNWGKKHDLLPIMYYPPENSIDVIKNAVAAFKNNSKNSDYEILGWAKPTYSKSGEKLINNYKESEWRKVYKSYGNQKWKTLDEYNAYKGDEKSPKRQVGSPLKFGVDDIVFIIVEDTYIDDLISYIETIDRIGGKELVAITPKDKLKLISKITAYEALKSNI